MTTTKQALLKLNKILYKLCISVEFASDVDTVQYLPTKDGYAKVQLECPSYKKYCSGKSIYKEFFSNQKDINNGIVQILAHEIGHYLVAPPKRRRQKDYGVKNKSSKLSKKVNLKYELEEVKAQAIQFEIYERIGLKNFKYDNGWDWRTRSDGDYDIRKWWQSQGKQLVDNMFYILGV